MGSSYRYLEFGTPCKIPSEFFLTVKLFQSFSGFPLILKGAPPTMGAKRWILRQIICLCGPIPASVQARAVNLDDLRDKQREGIHHLQRI